MAAFRILVANEPLAYRETMAAALRCLRPDADIAEETSERLALAPPDLLPHLLICSDAALPDRIPAPAWLLLYAEGNPSVVVCLDGDRREFPDITFDDLLAVVDRAALPAAAR